MGNRKRSIGISLAIVPLLINISSVLAAPAPQSVGNMKRIIIPEKGEPQVTIAPNRAASGNAPSPAAGVSNPLPGGVPVPSLIQGGIRAGGPGPTPLR